MPNSEYSNPPFLSPIMSREGLTKTYYEYLLMLRLAPHRVTSSITSMTFFGLSYTNCFRHVVNILVGNSIPLPLPHWGIVRALVVSGRQCQQVLAVLVSGTARTVGITWIQRITDWLARTCVDLMPKTMH